MGVYLVIILEPKSTTISKVIIGQIYLQVDFFPLKYKKKMVYFAFIKIDYVRKFQYFQCFDSLFSLIWYCKEA